jgi:hypothetical protein
MTSDKLARIWLWLEGYDYIQGNGDGLWQALRTTIENLWQSLQSEFPGIPDLVAMTQTPVSDSAWTAVGDAGDNLAGGTQMVKVAHESRDAEAASVLVAQAFLGLDTGELWRDAHEQHDAAGGDGTGKPDPDNPLESRLARAFFKAQGLPAPDLPPPDGEQLSMTELLSAIALPRLMQRRVDWGAVRQMWRALCTVANDPRPKPHDNPFISWGCTIRRRVYGAGDAGLGTAIMAMIALCSLAPADETARHARRVLAVAHQQAS